MHACVRVCVCVSVQVYMYVCLLCYWDIIAEFRSLVRV